MTSKEKPDQSYEAKVKEIQRQALADLNEQLAESEAKARHDSVRTERQTLMIEFVDARQKRGWSQAELAKRVKAQQSAISRLESAKSNPSLNTLLKIARALDVRLVLK